MPATVSNLSAGQLAKYIQIAYKQRERAAKKFADDYGPSSATVSEVSLELAEMNKAITELTIAANVGDKPKNK